MAGSLINGKTIVGKNIRSFTVKQADQSALYTAISNGTELIPPYSQVTLVTSGNVRTTKQTAEVASTWANAQSVGISGASKAAIAALTTNTTPPATDLATAQALANSLQTSVNAIIAALKA